MRRLVGLALSFVIVAVLVYPGLSQAQVRLTVQTYWDPETPSGAALVELLDEFEKSHPGVDIEHVYVPFAQLLKTILQQSLTGSLPDVVFADNPDVRHLAAAGVFKDITPLVQEWGEWEDFFVGPRYATTLKGKIYAVQFVTNNLALYYNRDLFKRAGIAEPPRTWQELLEMCQVIASRLTGVYCIGFSAVDSEEGTWQFLPFLWSNRGSLLELDKPEAVEALRLWTTLVQNGYTPRDVINWSQADVRLQFALGKLAMMVNGPWELPNVRSAGVNFGIAPLPVPSASGAPVVPMGGEAFGLASTIDPGKVAVAWELIKFLMRPENMARQNLKQGTIPTRRAAAPLVLRGEPQLEMFIRQAEHALPRPVMGGDEKYSPISAITRRFIQQALAGVLKPEEAFRQASREVRALFASDKEHQEAVSQARKALEDVLGGR